MINVSPTWCARWPGAHCGFLAMQGVANPAANTDLEARKRALEAELRARFAGQEPHAVNTWGPLPVYATYYRAFNKTYHVSGQLSSVVFKDKPIPSVAALVEAMFMAELNSGLLTAGHDLDRLRLPVTVHAAQGDEQYTLLRGTDQTLKPGDMYIADEEGILSSIIYGPDQRTQLRPETRRALFTVYAPAGIGVPALQAHLDELRDLVQVISPTAAVEWLQIVPAGAD